MAVYGTVLTAEYSSQRKREPVVNVHEIEKSIQKSDDLLAARLRKTEWEERNSWNKMCPHGIR